jgi:hypothetical protein
MRLKLTHRDVGPHTPYHNVPSSPGPGSRKLYRKAKEETHRADENRPFIFANWNNREATNLRAAPSRLSNENAPLADITAECFGKTQQRARNASLDGKKHHLHAVCSQGATFQPTFGNAKCEGGARAAG